MRGLSQRKQLSYHLRKGERGQAVAFMRMMQSVSVTRQTIGRVTEEMRAFLQGGPVIYTFRSQLAFMPEISPGLFLEHVKGVETMALVGFHDYPHTPIPIYQNTTLYFLPDRIVATGICEQQFIRGREPSEIEEELNGFLPLTLEQAQQLQSQIQSELHPAIEVSLIRGPFSTSLMNTSLREQGRMYCLALMLKATHRTFLNVFPLIQFSQWERVAKLARPLPPGQLCLPETCSTEERLLIEDYSQMLLALQQ